MICGVDVGSCLNTGKPVDNESNSVSFINKNNLPTVNQDFGNPPRLMLERRSETSIQSRGASYHLRFKHNACSIIAMGKGGK